MLKEYTRFVDNITSEASKDNTALAERIKNMDFPIARLLTAGIGLASEGGEFLDLVKKIVFHGKPINEENKQKLRSEISDIFWYYTQALISLDVSLEEIVQENMEKLLKRYPEGSFSVERSENRVEKT